MSEKGNDRRSTALADLVQELQSRPATARRRPRIGLVGVAPSHLGRLQDLAGSGLVDVRSVSDPSPDATRAAAAQLRNTAPNLRVLADVGQMMQERLDGLVFGRSAPHRTASIADALARGIAVFSEHPLSGDAAETHDIVMLARANDRLLAVDFPFRDLPGVAEMAALVRDGAIGEVFSAELAYHTVRRPEPPMPGVAPVGCLVELGSHLVDLVLHVLGEPDVDGVRGRRYASGRLLDPAQRGVAEDFATAELLAGRDIGVRLACSTRSAIAGESHVDATFIGTRGTMRLRNVPGNPTAFRVEHYEGQRYRTLGGALEAGGGRAAVAWARRLASGPSFDEAAMRIARVAGIVERIALAEPR